MKWLIQLRVVLEQLCVTGFQGSLVLLSIQSLFMIHDETMGVYSALVTGTFISVFIILYIIINSILICVEVGAWLSNK